MNNASKGRCVTVTPRGIAYRSPPGLDRSRRNESLERKSEFANHPAASAPFRSLANARSFQRRESELGRFPNCPGSDLAPEHGDLGERAYWDGYMVA